MILFSLCDINVPLFLLLGWLLPFLLGWLLGRLRNSSDSNNDDLEACVNAKNDLSNQVYSLQADLDACEKRKLHLETQMSSLNVKLDDATRKYDALALTAIKSTPSASKSVKGIGIYASLSSDNLQIVEGVGPKMNELLHKHNIKNWQNLSNSKPTELRTILNEYGNKYRMIDPATWPEQASMANKGNWEKLISYQKDLGKGISSSTHQTDSKVEKILIKAGVLRKFKLNDLKAIEGIGPKIEGLLNDAGINTWKDLSDAKMETLTSILENAGKRYALADPGTWAQQSGLAADQKWHELRELQDKLKGGRDV